MECKNCKSRNLVKDHVHAELYCANCGLVHEHPPHKDEKPALRYCYH